MKSSDILNGRYRIIKQIGEGGMAKVFLARDTYLNRDVAVKFLKNITDVEQQKRNFVRFQREIKSLINLTNRNVVQIYDVVDEIDATGNQIIYIVMEYVSSTNLKDIIKKRAPLNHIEALYFFREMLNCIEETHKKNIIHRDLKPHNILIADDGVVKIVDFGIALINDGIEITSTNNVVGSIQYIAPEILQNKPPSFQSDIYALGAILFEMLIGKPPYTGKNVAAIARLHINSSIPSVLNYNLDIPEEVDIIIKKATAKDLNVRYKLVREIIKDVDIVLKGKKSLQFESKTVPHENYPVSETKNKPNKAEDAVVNGSFLTTNQFLIALIILLSGTLVGIIIMILEITTVI